MAMSDGNRDDVERFEGDEAQQHEWSEQDQWEGDGGASEPDRLALQDEETSLPWLESGDDDYEEESSDTGRILGFVILGLIALAAIVGGIWWASHRSTDPELVADGSTIAAPEQPFKEAPANPGGKTFDGTGDTSFAVSEGQNRPAKLGEGAGAPSPSVDLSAKPGAPAAAAPAAGAAAAAGAASAGNVAGVGVQVGAYSSRAAAEAGWAKLQANPALSGVRHRIVEGQADIGTVFRLQAVAGDAAAANALCGRLKAANVACQVKN